MSIKVLTSRLVSLKKECSDITVKQKEKGFSVKLFYRNGETSETIVDEIEDDVDFIFIKTNNCEYKYLQYYHNGDFFINIYKHSI